MVETEFDVVVDKDFDVMEGEEIAINSFLKI
jgi:hypothetical protein